MGCISKTVVRGVVITALAGGVLVAVAGPQRVGMLFDQTRSNVISVIDSNIDDPVLLRSQIKKLEAQYPGKIAEVRSDLNDVQTQISQLERELQIANKVVELAGGDLQVVDAQIAQARVTQSANPGAIVRISFNNKPVDLDDAYGKREQIEQNRNMFAMRAVDLNTDLGYLRDQETQLADLHERLTTEQSEFQSKLFQLDAQIDSIARNDRMIEMMEDRQATIDEHSRFQANSLDQLNNRLAQIRTEQRARIETITNKDAVYDIETRAKWEIDRNAQPHQVQPSEPLLIEPTVIEITPEDAQPSEPLASNN
jgi:predicted RNase H-like nuclease (RuvC/YqgF family)